MYRMWYICVYIDLYMYFVQYQILKYSSWYEGKRVWNYLQQVIIINKSSLSFLSLSMFLACS